MRRVNRRWTLGLLVGFGLLASGLVLAGCGKNAAAEEGSKDQLTPVQVLPLSRTDIVDKLSYVADLKAQAEVKLYSSVPDRILYFPFKDGDLVKQGQRIAVVRAEGLDKGLEGLTAQMESLDVQILNLREEVARSQELLKKGVLTQSQFDKLDSSLKATEAQRRALEANRGQLAVTASNAIITAPIEGVIAGKMLEKGDMATPQLPLCRILGVEKLKAFVSLVEEDVPRVRVGQKVQLTVDAYPEKVFEGEVTAVMPFLDQATRTNQIEITLPNPVDEADGRRLLKPGMFGRAELVVGLKEKTLVAPERALMLDSQILEKQKPGEILRKAYVEKDGVVQRRLVRLGARKGSLFEVLEGLNEGERIVVRGQHQLKDGDKVEVVATAAN